MAEYIEREELKKVLSNEAVHCLTFQKTGEARGLVKAKEIISKLPAADVVEVVRCKDCAFYTELDIEYTFLGKRARMCFMHSKPMGENNFCSYGMKRSDAK